MRVPISAAHGSQKLAGKHTLLTLGPDKEKARGERTEKRGGRRRGAVGKEGGRGALANLQEGRLSHQMLAELLPLCGVCVCVCEERKRVCDQKNSSFSSLSSGEFQ